MVVLLAASPAIIALLNRALQATGIATSVDAPIGYARAMASLALEHPEQVFRVAWSEWAWPFAPISVLWIAAYRVPRLRRLSIGFVIALVVYLTASFLVLAQWAEFGAYLAPCAWIGVYLTTRALPTMPLVLSLLATVGLATAVVRDHDDVSWSRSYAEGVQEIRGERPVFLFVGSMPEVEARYVQMPTTEFYFLPEGGLLTEQGARLAIPGFDAFVAEKLDAGYVVLLTRPTWWHMQDAVTLELHPGLRIAREHIESTYEMQAVESHAFAGFVMRRRQ